MPERSLARGCLSSSTFASRVKLARAKFKIKRNDAKQVHPRLTGRSKCQSEIMQAGTLYKVYGPIAIRRSETTALISGPSTPAVIVVDVTLPSSRPCIRANSSDIIQVTLLPRSTIASALMLFSISTGIRGMFPLLLVTMITVPDSVECGQSRGKNRPRAFGKSISSIPCSIKSEPRRSGGSWIGVSGRLNGPNAQDVYVVDG